MPSITWLSWSAESFARARGEAKPVLLSITPAWCPFSRAMDTSSFVDPDVCALVARSFVPVRVDADRRPDVSGRYSLGGWPTTVFLTPDGQVVGGGTYVAADRLADALRGVAAAFAAGRHIGRTPGHPSRPPPGAAPPSADDLTEGVLSMFDERHGGFGDRPKFPHVAPVRLALALFRETGLPRYQDIAVTTLDAMGWSELYDEEHGGFFSYAYEADWSRPNEAKLLAVNAALLSLYVEAFELLQLTRYGERAADLLRYTQSWLADPAEGGWAASQRADPDYYARRPGRPEAAPPVDRTLYADWNAAMASAMLQAGRVLGDPSLSEFAIKSLERMLLLAYRPGFGIAHYVEDGVPHVRGLLEDQIATAAASLDAFEATGNVVYEMMAQELALYATRTMWDGEADGFLDRAPDPRRDIGLLRQPVRPFAANCLAARTLRRVARTSGGSEYDEYADRVLAAISGRAAEEGPAAAEYLLALRPPAER